MPVTKPHIIEEQLRCSAPSDKVPDSQPRLTLSASKVQSKQDDTENVTGGCTKFHT